MIRCDKSWSGFGIWTSHRSPIDIHPSFNCTATKTPSHIHTRTSTVSTHTRTYNHTHRQTQQSLIAKQDIQWWSVIQEELDKWSLLILPVSPSLPSKDMDKKSSSLCSSSTSFSICHDVKSITSYLTPPKKCCLFRAQGKTEPHSYRALHADRCGNLDISLQVLTSNPRVGEWISFVLLF